ncbi:assimilatory sulfite reductase (NADPH) flavoprotein subunit [Labilibaculum euxinus]|uniref:assimilatory sulfite reductase (NADPH) n=1 Tax=Labilibaculum euxinus TaxID=2686357 RepID=A0A7M4D4E0_9BACT|nr:assimilatory sulfite reductase (NADPH) flavoprotein subunit [Labilibaculum euxinus]MUP37519.1 assimilatory sulfite reductase (NADPH) flavoprotein subunit [Labilibaculum euxinus]MVB06724.1 assimilatory sulfite reductase (NADPH) flavoprotein subunit [Labilibaculum euxinus]
MGKEFQINQEQLSQLNKLIQDLSAEQLVWVNGYLSGIINGKKNAIDVPIISDQKSSESITILFGTHTGHSKEIAMDLHDRVLALGFDAKIQGLDFYTKNDLKKEKYLFLIVSTHGEGEAPIQAEDLYEYVHGKRAPKLPDTKYAVLALGDKTYKKYCQTGIDFDLAFTKLGAQAILPVQTSDVAYEEVAEQWIEKVTGELKSLVPKVIASTQSASASVPKKKFNRANPYYAEVLEKVRITTTDSEKEIYHVEISLENSGIEYTAGDSIGILPNNPIDLMDLIIDKLEDDPERIVTIDEKEISLFRALQNKLEITVLNREVLEKYKAITQNKDLELLLNNEDELENYLHGADAYDLLEDYPGEITSDQFLSTLRVLYARLYSISSGPKANPEEVHITIASVRYNRKKRDRNGACSSYITDEINVGDHLPIYIDKNESFRLPDDENKPLIMVGAGTGVAPYRSFLQEREQNKAKGKSWLFFGNQRFKKDFLYQLEWQKFLKKGILQKLDVAFSRDQEEKAYVQHRLKENGKEIFQWLENGAHFYICGDKKYMAKDVQTSLLEIIQNEGGITPEKAEEYLKNLKREKRLLLDVY